MDKKTIVLTLYGNKKSISDFSITLFDNPGYYDDSTAQLFCSNINELELKDDNWIHAAIIKENHKIKFEKPEIGFNILSTLDDRTIQNIIQRTEHDVLIKALKGAKKEILNAVLRNMSQGAAYMFVEDSNYMGQVRLEDVKEAQKKIVEMMQSMERTGELTILNYFNSDEN